MTVLAGLRVLDLSTGTTAALSAALLTDFGADVIRIVDADPRLSTAALTPDWVVSNRGKRLGLREPDAEAGAAAGVGEIARLLNDCNVVIADDLAVLDSFGITADTVGDRVVLVLPPYSEAETPWVTGGESVELLTALTGLPTNQSSYSGDPVDAVYPYLRYAHAAWAATCALAALVEWQRSGCGQLVTVSGLHAANVFCGFLYGRPDSVLDSPRTGGPGGTHPVYRRYQGADGTWFFVGGLSPKFGHAVLEIAGSIDLLNDPRVGSFPKLWAPENSGWVIAHLEKVFAQQPAAHWLRLLEAADVPCTTLFTREEWFAGAQVAASGQRQEVVDPLLGPVVMVSSPVTVDGRPAVASPTAAALPLAELVWRESSRWQPAPDVASDPSSGCGPLAGIRVATLGSFVAGPYVGCLLANLGAAVVKVEPPQGDPWRVQGFVYNRGARGLSAEMRAAAGEEAVHRVLETCDLVLDNFRLGVTERLRISHKDLQRDGGGTVTVSVTAYGAYGPLAGLPGYDTVVQAASGMMTALGGPDEPVMSALPNVDHTTGAVGAFTAVLGLLHRARTGEAVHLSTSLAGVALYIQAAELVDFANRPPGRVGGRDFAGPTALDRIYRVADGFVRIQTESLHPTAWADAGLALSPALDTAAAIAAALADLSRADALAALGRAGVRAAAVRESSEIVNDPALHAGGLLERHPAAGGLRMVMPGRLADFSRTQQLEVLPAPGLGEHTRELLAEAGYSDEEIDKLTETGQVVTGAPLELVYLPPYR